MFGTEPSATRDDEMCLTEQASLVADLFLGDNNRSGALPPAIGTLESLAGLDPG
ncbi:MAG: hypothetical protein NDJ92_05770 [Thermoanaerobaculia bacterium]|nr:hypothetical protein [Thermoanaerobaculia bacterium]